MTRVVVAPCSMKGALTATATAAAMARGVRRRAPHVEIDELPIADGGEGTVAALASRADLVTVDVTDLRGVLRQVDIALLTEHHAVVECASVLGLPLVPVHDRDPRRVSSLALASLIERAVSLGARRVTIAIGGTATVDGGLGLLIGLGARVTTSDGREVSPLGESVLDDIAVVDLAPLKDRLGDVVIDGLTDVTSPLVGHDGARLYMAQKGADDELALALERGLVRLVDAAGRADLVYAEGAGAGGGLGAAVLLLGGTLSSGAEFVLDALHVDAVIEGALLVVTGEGRFDAQTGHGKAVAALSRRAARHGVPVVALVGERALVDERGPLPSMVVSIARGPMTRDEMMRDAAVLVEEAAFELAGMLPAPGVA